MARQLQHFVQPVDPCSYLPDRSARLETRVLLGVSPAELEHLLERGWRRFGPMYFRPACEGCRECVSLRIPLARYEPTRSQRRALRHLDKLALEVRAPSVDEERLALYRRWHALRERERGWNPAPLDAESYGVEFAFAHPAAREVSWREQGELRGISLVDETPHALSAVYFYYDPSLVKRSPGVGNVAWLAQWGRSLGKTHLYLGFRVLGCASMRYKARFGPQELLRGSVDVSDTPRWMPGEAEAE